jgi:SAM-dependent methyltransferase
MLKMAAVKPEDVVVDLGSGDGRIVIAAVKTFGARKAVGIEISANLVRIARENAAKAGVTDRVEFRNDDLFDYDLSSATVVTLYLLPEVNLKLRPRLLDLKPGTRIVAHQFGMGDWQPDSSRKALGDRDPQGPATVYFWVVPAKAAGAWRWQEGSNRMELAIKQTFQKIQPTLKTGNVTERVEAPELVGDHIFFVAVRKAGPYDYEGRVSGNTISGTVKGPDGSVSPWKAQAATVPVADKR